MSHSTNRSTYIAAGGNELRNYLGIIELSTECFGILTPAVVLEMLELYDPDSPSWSHTISDSY